MCIDCGCGPTKEAQGHGDQERKSRTVRIEEDLLSKNNRLAARNREQFLLQEVLVLNLVSSPGSGKTSILERTLSDLKHEICCAVLEGDQQTNNDAQRIAATGVPVKQINTGAGCHLDAHMVGHGIEPFDLLSTDLLLIENVGNLVCPAVFDLGEDHKVVVLSVTEGEDKPLKYPQMFQVSDLLLVNKIDLLPHLDFNLEACIAFAKEVNPNIEIIEMSCSEGSGMEAWYEWLREKVQLKNAAIGD